MLMIEESERVKQIEAQSEERRKKSRTDKITAVNNAFTKMLCNDNNHAIDDATAFVFEVESGKIRLIHDN